MKTTALLLAAALFAPAAGALAQSATFVAAASALGPAAAPQATAPMAPSGSVTYFGLVSSHDAQHAQFAQLRQVFATSRPTLVLLEKPDMGVDSTEAATVSRCGETGYVRLLAQQHGVRTERLDDAQAEYEYLRARTEPAQLQVYYLLRLSQQYCHNVHPSKAVLQQAMQQFLANSYAILPGAALPVRSLPELAAAYRQLCPGGGAWQQVALGTRPAPAFAQHLDEDARAFQLQRLAQRVAQHTQAGERVLVVLDASHLPAPAATYAATAPRGR
ncbi:hypothetical protein HHL22_00875 [Hymenobacter sp. RP-2-7]|uniref:Uncharacterized protein n=1 Tax=Hymenobacter polaris TaxID=2682546 RepID=A0A7Y0FKP2_9BACT|nr:hypothetical protein [Hymenobacter polaris]NML63750.1 hypothetical protein [Hymenobacter polaris]